LARAGIFLDLKRIDRYNLTQRINWCALGLIDYEKAFALQERLKGRLRKEAKAGYLLLLEHPPTITLGYSLRGDEGRSEIRASVGKLKEAGIKVFQVDRGGKATYHGPGQLVGYPILDLRRFGLGAKRYIGKMEDILLKILKELGVDARIDDRYPGLWVGDEKIAALGVRIQDRLTTHGFAINLDPELEHFAYIVPCGIAQRGVTSLARVRRHVPPMSELIERVVRLFGEEFSSEMYESLPEELLSIE
jgi:lipoyl(octanoyl) transferase